MKQLLFILFLIPIFSHAQDTIIVVGKNPKYVELYKDRMSLGLKYKLPKGTYYYYMLKNKYWKKVYASGYSDLENEITKEKYRGYLSSVITYGSDSLMIGEAKFYKYNAESKKSVLSTVINYSHGIKNGIAIEYHHNGNIESIGTYKNNKEDGTWYYFGKSPENSVGKIEYKSGEVKIETRTK